MECQEPMGDQGSRAAGLFVAWVPGALRRMNVGKPKPRDDASDKKKANPLTIVLAPATFQEGSGPK